MSWYERTLFNRMMDWSLDRPRVHAERRRTLKGVWGEILEIGLGTGLNIPHYPPEVTHITSLTLDPEPSPQARRRAQQRGMSLTHLQGDGRRIPAPDESFDTIVCTLTLCTVADPPAVIAEMFRVLRPEGRLYFFEHVVAEPGFTRTVQRMATPIQRCIACGCTLTRDTEPALRDGGFEFEQLHDYHSDALPWPARRVIRGIAIRGM